MKLKVLDLFSGIGGFTLAAKLASPDAFETIAYCEIDKEARKVLKKRFPNTPVFKDVRTIDADTILKSCGALPDIICGGFPCQDLSVAGKKMGLSGNRSGLFFEIIRLAREIRPRYLFLENVAALLSSHQRRDMGTVLWSLASVGYDAEWDCIPASEIGATHKRDRIWILAYPHEK